MTPQLDIFRQWFSEYGDCYVVIGGTAVQLLQERSGHLARRTKDIDLVLLLRERSHPFYAHFWNFVRQGGYSVGGKQGEKGHYYRFRRPQKDNFPQEIELFSREPEAFPIAEGSILTPIPTDEGVSSLSAILLDKEYDAFMRSGVIEVEGISILDEWHMIPLKARAWLDLSARRKAGEHVDRSDIEKHRKDVFRLAYYLAAEQNVSDLPRGIKQDMLDFLRAMMVAPFNTATLGILMPFDEMLRHMTNLYGLHHAAL